MVVDHFEPIYAPGGEPVTDDDPADTEAWLNSLSNPTATPVVGNTEDLRAIAENSDELARVQARLTEAIQVVRAHGRSWTDIAFRLGVTRQGARQRYATDVAAVRAKTSTSRGPRTGSQAPSSSWPDGRNGETPIGRVAQVTDPSQSRL